MAQKKYGDEFFTTEINDCDESHPFIKELENLKVLFLRMRACTTARAKRQVAKEKQRRDALLKSKQL